MVDAERLARLVARVAADVTDRVSLAVGFRNVLVHEYAEVDDARVVANLSLLDDLDAFVGQLASWARRPLPSAVSRRRRPAL